VPLLSLPTSEGLLCRKRIGSLEQDCSGLQRELHEAREALGRQRDEHEAAQSAAAESIAAALRGAQETQGTLDAREARVQELQVGWGS
jgi:hypothetical protein